MSTDRPGRSTMLIKDSTISHMWEIVPTFKGVGRTRATST